jgi:hypothetical protein
MIVRLLITICSVGYVLGAASASAGALTVADLLSGGDDIQLLYTHGEVVLNLARKGLTGLEGLGTIAGITTVQRLVVSNNKLRSLKKSDLSCMPSLRFLHADCNQLESIEEDTFFSHFDLKGLNLMCNKLQDVTAVVAVFYRLTHIDLTANQVKSFEPTCKNENLRYLSLVRNEHDGYWPLHRNIYQCCPQLHPVPRSHGEYFYCD